MNFQTSSVWALVGAPFIEQSWPGIGACGLLLKLPRYRTLSASHTSAPAMDPTPSPTKSLQIPLGTVASTQY